MPSNENEPPSTATLGRRQRTPEYALELGPRKKATFSDPLVHHGRHFGRTIHAFCQVQALLSNGLVREADGLDADDPHFSLSIKEKNEHRVFRQLLQLVPGLQERLFLGSEEDIVHIGELVQRGTNGARSDDTKGLKGAILDWIVPEGQHLNPPISRNVKTTRGFHHDRTGALLCPTGLDWNNAEVKAKLRSGEMSIPGDQWPVFLYVNSMYDSNHPWVGLLRSAILLRAFKFIFTSPSSVDKEPRATRSGNARIHGMVKVTPASIAYVATQVRFALSSSPVFSRTDTTTDSERFYSSVLSLLTDPEEQEEIDSLMLWWNRQVFPGHSSAHRPISKNSALARIKEQRAQRALRALDSLSLTIPS